MKVRWYFFGLITLVACTLPERAAATLIPKCISTDSLPPAHMWLHLLPGKSPPLEVKQPLNWWQQLEFSFPEVAPTKRLAERIPNKSSYGILAGLMPEIRLDELIEIVPILNTYQLSTVIWVCSVATLINNGDPVDKTSPWNILDG